MNVIERNEPTKLLTPAEVAALFRVDPKTVTRWAEAGRLTSIRTLGGHRRYAEDEVERLIRGEPTATVKGGGRGIGGREGSQSSGRKESCIVNGTPAIRQCVVGAALRQYRENMGFGLDAAAKVLECDRSKISRIETGQRGIRSQELRVLLSEYGVSEHEQAALVALANPKRASGWWQDYRDILAGQQRDMMIMESLATQVFIYHTHQIPGLLQTEEYARAAVHASNVPPASGIGQRAVEALLARQRATLGAEDKELAVVIAEGALRQQVGGADVMHAQLTRLAMADSTYPRVSVRVLPFASGAHAGLDAGGLTILRFAETPDLGIVHIPGISGGICLKDHDLVAHYAVVFSQIRDAALTVDASAELLYRMAAR